MACIGQKDRPPNPWKNFRRNKRDVDINQMRFSGLIGVDAEALHRSIPAGSEQERIET